MSGSLPNAQAETALDAAGQRIPHLMPPEEPVPSDDRPVGFMTILRTWWPLAGSWLLMGVELPAIAAVMSRLDDAEVQLAAFGGLVFPLALLIEAPIMMMLAASAALSTDRASYRALQNFMLKLAIGLTVLHGLLAFTPLLDVIAIGVLGVPEEVLGPGRLGMQIMLPWTLAIADRRFNQGALIKCGMQRQVAIGTVVRLLSTATPLCIGIMVGSIPGIVIGTSALSTGVVVECIYIRIVTHRTIRAKLPMTSPDGKELTNRRILSFYVPLAITPLVALLSQPIGSAGISRMPNALASLAVWPAVAGLSFALRSIGVAFNEVSVRHAGDRGSLRSMSQFAWVMGTAFSLILAIVAFTPIAGWWFGSVTDLDPELVPLACTAFAWTLLLPWASFQISLYQGVLVHHRMTRQVTESVIVNVTFFTGSLLLLTIFDPMDGASAAMLATTIGVLAHVAWLRYRMRLVHSRMAH